MPGREGGWTVFYFVSSLQSSICGTDYRGRRAGLNSSGLRSVGTKIRLFSVLADTCSRKGSYCFVGGPGDR